MRRPKAFSEELKLQLGEEPVDLTAYRLAHRLFWFRTAGGDEVNFQTLYEQVRALLKREAALENAEAP